MEQRIFGAAKKNFSLGLLFKFYGGNERRPQIEKYLQYRQGMNLIFIHLLFHLRATNEDMYIQFLGKISNGT